MTLFFIELNIILFYRLFLGERTGYVFRRILQRDEHNKNLLSSLSTRIEMVSLEQANGGWKHLYRLC